MLTVVNELQAAQTVLQDAWAFQAVNVRLRRCMVVHQAVVSLSGRVWAHLYSLAVGYHYQRLCACVRSLVYVWDWRRVKSCFCWGVSGWIRSASVPGQKEREREHVHVCTKMPASLFFFCAGCKLGGFKCIQVYKGLVRWELLNIHNSGKCGGEEVSKSIDISTLKRAHLKSARRVCYSAHTCSVVSCL